MDKQGKIWGFTSELFSKNNVEIHRIEGKSNFHCSKHKHEHKYNMFFVESGKIKIERWKNDYDLIDETFLEHGQSCSVPPGEYHRFSVVNRCVVYEIYWVEINNKDIIRESIGGVDE